MNDWQIVPKRRTISGLKFALHGGSKLTVYIGAGTRRKIKGYKPNGYCNVYTKGDYLMVQFTCIPNKNSRVIGNSVFSLPYGLVSKHWQDGAREILIPAVVEKASLIVLDLKDLAR